MLIGIGHVARTGKSTAAEILEAEGFTRLSFAEPIRRMAYDSMPFVRSVVDEHGWLDAQRVPEIRVTLQKLGVSVRNHIWPEVLIDTAFQQIAGHLDYVFSDVRFVNEAEALIDAGGRVYRIDRPGVGPVNHHESETDLLTWDGWSGVIDNDGSVADLAVKVKQIVNDIRLAGG